jgi:hypothetical protein
VLKYDADVVALGPTANCWRRYGRERIVSFVKDRRAGRLPALRLSYLDADELPNPGDP